MLSHLERPGTFQLQLAGTANMKSFKLIAGVAAMLAGPVAAMAQDRAWDIQAAAYLWLPESRTGIATPFGQANSELSASDAVDALDFGTMLAVNARNGDWSVLGDLIYLDLTLEGKTPLGLLYSGAEARTKLTAVSAYGLYRFYDIGAVSLEAGGGLRLMSSDIDVTLRGAGVGDRQFSISDSWVDPLIALRATGRLSDQLQGVMLVDGGGFGIGSASDKTWQISARIDWQINDKWTLGAGYRTLYVDRENDGVPYDLRMSGPVLGLSTRF